MRIRKLGLILVCLWVALPVLVRTQDAEPVELRMLWYNDGNESVILQQLIDEFEEQNPNISVELELSTASEVNMILRQGLEAGNSPDLARTNLPSDFRGDLLDLRPYLADPTYWEENFNNAFLASMRESTDSDAIHGYSADVTISGPFINRTLWEQAGVPIPSDTQAEVTWDEWVLAALQVQAALSTSEDQVYAIAMDYSGHRFWGPSLSLCASYVDPSDPLSEVQIDTEGFREAVQMLKSWHDNGLIPMSIWTDDATNRVFAQEFFLEGQVAFYFSGNWQVPRFQSEIDDFEWENVPNPVGECGQTGMIGGTSVIALDTTDHPEALGQFMDFLVAEENLARFYEENRLLPGHQGINSREQGLDYGELSTQLGLFQQEIARAENEAFALQYRPDSSTIHGAIRQALVATVVNDLSTDDTVACAEYYLNGGDENCLLYLATDDE